MTDTKVNLALTDIENRIQNIVHWIENRDQHLAQMMQELKIRINELKRFVADNSWNGYFHQYSLKSKPVKECISAIDKELSECPKELSQLGEDLNEAI